MAVSPGSRLGPYEIVAKLGSGGMGEVYSARDSRLDRLVAIKVLPEAMAADAERRRRFEREAKAAAALNHPNICVLHEVGDHEGHAFLVMEYIRGRSLRQLTCKDGLPVETVLRFGIQIAEAMAYAHERGVVHRDLKSSNVMVSESGLIKVVDFGLAKQSKQSGRNDHSETMSLTEAGKIVGTLDYMAPEVLVGKAADVRSDIWAIGVLLHVMTAGTMPFAGRTTFELTSAILREPPAPLVGRVPAGLRAVIRRCLAKEPARRYQRASEVQAALEAAREQISSSDYDRVSDPRSEAVTELRSGVAAGSEAGGSRAGTQTAPLTESSVELQALMRIAGSLVVIVKTVGFVAIAFLILAMLGFVTGATFDLALRVPMQHSVLDYAILGARSMVPIVARVVFIAVPVVVGVALLRLILIRFADRGRRRWFQLVRARVDETSPPLIVAGFVVVAAACTSGVLAAGLDLLWAVETLVEKPVGTMVDTELLGAGSYGYQSRYYWVCAAATLVILAVWFLLGTAFSREDVPRVPRHLVHVIGAVALIGILLLAAAPWELLFASDREQITFEGRRAFIISRVEDRLYLYVPGVARNRIQVSASDPRVERPPELVTANIFGDAE